MRPLRNRGGGARLAGRRGRRPLRWSLCPLRIRKVSGSKDVPAGRIYPAPTEGGVFFTNRKPCGKQMPRPLGRAGIKSEKAGFRLKNRLIVIFEVKSGFFPPLWGSRGAGPPGVGSALGRLTPAIRLTPDRACGCRRCLHLALPIFADAQMWPHAPNPASPRTAGLFSVPLLVTKEEQPHGRQPSPACPRI